MYRHATACRLGWTFAFIALTAAGCTTQPVLTSQQIHELTDGQAVGQVAVSPDGSLLAWSDGTNIFVMPLHDETAQLEPIQVTNVPEGASAFGPSFLLSGDRLVFGMIDATVPDEIQLFSTRPDALLGEPSPDPFANISAVDLGLATGTPLSVPDQLLITGNGGFGTAVIDEESFLLDFDTTPVAVTQLNGIFGGPVRNPVISPDLSQFAFTDATGQIGVTSFTGGVLEPSNVTFIGNGSFPAFTPGNQLTFFNDNGFNIGSPTTGFSTIGVGGIQPTFPVFSPSGTSFFSTNTAGTGIFVNNIPSTFIGGA